ncbi:MAG: hypothetical protein ACOZNI_37820 [Myxococcota bacterium]
MLLVLACAEPAPADPRPDLLARLPAEGPADPLAALLREDHAAACRGFAARARQGEDAWLGLLTAAARGGACLSDADGDALAAWGGPEWAGARAEWAHRRGRPVALTEGFPASRLRIAVAKGRFDRDLADAALAEEPRDGLACWIVARASLEAGDLLAATEQAACDGTRNAKLSRVIGEALDAAGDVEGAVAAFREAGADEHAAAVLLAEGRLAEARALATAPPAVLLRGWIDHAEGRPVDVAPLGDTPEERILTALATGDAGRLDGLDGPEAAVARARITGDPSGLARAIAADPALEPLHRAAKALGGRSAWDAVDPDHARLRGARGDRDLPWAVIAPWPPLPAPRGEDEIGRAWRAAVALPDRTARIDALAALQAAHPELVGLAAARYAAAAGLDARPPGP